LRPITLNWTPQRVFWQTAGLSRFRQKQVERALMRATVTLLRGFIEHNAAKFF
jgi:hypothetical protein